MGVSLLSTVAAATYARRIEPAWLEVTQIDIPIPNLAPHLQGKRIAQLSDIHLSDFVSPHQLSTAVDIINDLAPDWVALTGDYVSRVPKAADGLVEPLRKLDSPTFAVLGNHDRWTDPILISRCFEEASVVLLQNQGIRLDQGLWLAGLDNYWGGTPNLRSALSTSPVNRLAYSQAHDGLAADRRLDGDTTIVLMHEPDYIDMIVKQDAPIALQLSGHSHGGQVRLPRLSTSASGLNSWAPVLPRYGVRYPIGLRKVAGRFVYTNRGLGVWPIRFRFNCRPELSIFTLHEA